jgi:hypothetical protein
MSVQELIQARHSKRARTAGPIARVPEHELRMITSGFDQLDATGTCTTGSSTGCDGACVNCCPKT